MEVAIRIVAGTSGWRGAVEREAEIRRGKGLSGERWVSYRSVERGRLHENGRFWKCDPPGKRNAPDGIAEDPMSGVLD